MAKSCSICGREPLKGNSRSHSNIASRRWQRVNLQKKRIKGISQNVCTRCIRSLNRKASLAGTAA